MSQEVTRLQEILNTLTPDQLNYVAVRPFVRFDYEAAKDIGVSRETVSRWDNKAEVDEAVRLMLSDGIHVAQEILSRSLAKAAKEISEELDHKSVNVRYRAATEVLDRIMGKSLQKTDVTSGGERIFDPEEWKKVALDQLAQISELEDE